MRPASLVVLIAVLAIAGCAGEAGTEPGTTDTPTPTRPTRSVPGLPTIPPSDPPITGEVPADVMARVLADAAERGGVPEDAIDVVRAEAVTWSDGSLGCPEPGMVYTQALVDGFHVVVEAGGDEFDYRVTADGGFRLCEGRRPGG